MNSIFKQEIDISQQSQNSKGKLEIFNSVLVCLKRDTALRDMNSGFFLVLSRIFWYYGCFSTSYILRMYSISRKLQEIDVKGIADGEVNIELYCLSERDIQLLESYEFLDKIFFLKWFELKRKKHSILDDLRSASSKKQLHEDQVRRTISPECDFIKDSQIVVIGPSLRATDLIITDQHTQVARIGYTGIDDVSTFQDYKTDISFYRNFKFNNLTQKDTENLMAHLNFAIVSELELENYKKVKHIKNIYKSEFSGRIIYGGDELNGGIEAILNIVNIGYSSVSVCNIDLFINRLYPKGYTVNNYSKVHSETGWSLADSDICWANAVNHSQTFQYALLSNLVSEKIITVDKFLFDILSTGIFDYTRVLEKTYYPVANKHSYA